MNRTNSCNTTPRGTLTIQKTQTRTQTSTDALVCLSQSNHGEAMKQYLQRKTDRDAHDHSTE